MTRQIYDRSKDHTTKRTTLHSALGISNVPETKSWSSFLHFELIYESQSFNFIFFKSNVIIFNTPIKSYECWFLCMLCSIDFCNQKYVLLLKAREIRNLWIWKWNRKKGATTCAVLVLIDSELKFSNEQFSTAVSFFWEPYLWLIFVGKHFFSSKHTNRIVLLLT